MDNFGWGELGVYGGGVLRGAPTPRIDKLASEGMRLASSAGTEFRSRSAAAITSSNARCVLLPMMCLSMNWDVIARIRTHLYVDDQLGQYHQRQRKQQPRMHFEIVQERNSHTVRE